MGRGELNGHGARLRQAFGRASQMFRRIERVFDELLVAARVDRFKATVSRRRAAPGSCGAASITGCSCYGSFRELPKFGKRVQCNASSELISARYTSVMTRFAERIRLSPVSKSSLAASSVNAELSSGDSTPRAITQDGPTVFSYLWPASVGLSFARPVSRDGGSHAGSARVPPYTCNQSGGQ